MMTSLALKLEAEPAAELVKPVVSVSFSLKDKDFRDEFGVRELTHLERAVACIFVTELAHDFRFLDFVLAEEHASAALSANTTGSPAGPDRIEVAENAAGASTYGEEIEVIAKAEDCESATEPGNAYKLRIDLRSRKVYQDKDDREYFFKAWLDEGTGRRLRAVRQGNKEVDLPFRGVELWGSKVGDPRTLFMEIKSVVVLDDAYQKRQVKRLGLKLLSRIPLTGAKVEILRKPEPAKLAWVVGTYDCDLCLDIKSRLRIEHKTFKEYESRREVEAEYMGRYLDTNDQNWKGTLFLEDPGGNINSDETIAIIREIPPKAEVMGIYVTDYARYDTACYNEYESKRYQPRRPEEVSFDEDDEDELSATSCTDRL